ncbi:hypothetical protein BKA69DRAFT_836486 [Paraphysoderma sedebokerense]|nr:hypothetical protein BKA69DRAFT_836486 [Paraphysoderma sedebokerense]
MVSIIILSRQISLINFNSAIALVHNGIGGNMADLTRSPWDPLFWMHHTGVDFWWAQWQSSVNGAYDGGAFSMGSYRNTDVDDYQNRLCYRYENIGGSGNGGSTPTGTATSATPTGTGAPTSSGTPAPSGSPAPPTNEDIIVPNLKDLQESFLKSFNIPPERISQMEPVFKAVEVYLNTLKAQGKPLPSLASLRDVKLPKNVEDAINGNIKGNEKETNSAASHVNLIVTGLAGLAGALIAAMVV